jgi:PD-(D/E)XK nuclease superfamily
MKSDTSIQHEELERFFSDLGFRLEIQSRTKSQLDRHLASEFNIFEFIEPDENRLSDILAMLLNPQGAHGQKELFLKLFLVRLGRNSEPSLQDAQVVREALTHTISSFLRRIDILMTSERFVLALENKVDAREQRDQLKNYHEHIQMLQEDYCLIFLTPDGRKPESISSDTASKLRGEHKLFELSYTKDIRQWLEECRRWCEAEKIRCFLADFIHYINTNLSTQSE